MTLVLTVGATVRLTRLLALDTIAFPVRDWLAAQTGNEDDDPSAKNRFFGFVEDMVTCPWCLSVWIGAVAAPVAWFHGQTAWFMIPALLLTASQVAGMALTREA